jgi:Abortive infection bacteriophage resistance protein
MPGEIITATLKSHQPPLDINGQIENLKALNLKFLDEDKARAFLNDVSYFRLIKAYGLGLKPRNGSFYSNITFEMIRDLYLFNSNLRQLLMPLIEIIEINLRCRIANYFSSTYGVFGFRDPANFNDPLKHSEFIQDIDKAIVCNIKSPFIKNYKKNYLGDDVPFYALVEVISFGPLSKMYKNMKKDDKKVIASTYKIGYTYLESWFESIAYLRNTCAHYGRLYNAILAIQPELYDQYSKAGIRNTRIFGLLTCIKHIIKPTDKTWIYFIQNLEELIKKYPCVNIALMGFPLNWIDILS